jgi:uncharacterized protein (UPF0332 family)
MSREEQLAAALIHVKKAREFLLAAEIFEGEEQVHVQISLAAISAINSGDALLLSKGQTAYGSNHNEAVTRLRKMGFVAESRDLHKALRDKNPAQYHPKLLRETAAKAALDAATHMLESAEEALK